MAGKANADVAERLREAALLLERQGADAFRVRACRRAAETVAETPRDLLEMIAKGGDSALMTLPGIGRSLAAAIAEIVLTGHWARLDALRSEQPPEEPPVALLLEVDAEYRRRAAASDLPRIAPRLHNPSHAAWLPILHGRRGGWQFTAVYSNTARAHDLHRTADWVVLHFRRDGGGGRRTVVTETRGAMAGRRVVRGRETECEP